MATLLDSEKILHEDGKEYLLENVPPQTRIWAHWNNTVEHIWKHEKIGEYLTYDFMPSRWRKSCNYSDHYWPSIGNEQDVYISNSNGFPEDKEKALSAYMDWRDWVEEYGGSAYGTIAAASKSIWRATLTENFESPYRGIRAVPFPLGGRLVPCKETHSVFTGEFIQWDLSSAYARKLGGLQFGGKGSRWVELKDDSSADYLTENGYLIYIQAMVWVPRMRFGPLPLRRHTYSPFSRTPIQYRTNWQCHGTWTHEEVKQARAVGCTVRVEKIWMHIPTGKRLYFQEWWNAIQDGREHLDGFAKSIAKQTGNSLWGQFAMRKRTRKIRWRTEEGRRESRVITPRLSKLPQSPELADQLAGKIRAELFELMTSAGELLMQGNIDGAWVEYRDGWLPPEGWRIKHRTPLLQFIDESNYRFWNEDDQDWQYVMAGVPKDMQPLLFEGWWKKQENGNSDFLEGDIIL
jgi:hypothetical protein